MKLYLEIRMIDECGRTHAVVRRELPEKAAYMGPRIVPDIKFGVYGSMDDVVEVMQVRELRRGILSDEAMMAGYQIADFLQDREGWHGADRQEAREEMLKQRQS